MLAQITQAGILLEICLDPLDRRRPRRYVCQHSDAAGIVQSTIGEAQKIVIVDHFTTLSLRDSLRLVIVRNASRPRDRRDMTVPTGISSASAASR